MLQEYSVQCAIQYPRKEGKSPIHPRKITPKKKHRSKKYTNERNNTKELSTKQKNEQEFPTECPRDYHGVYFEVLLFELYARQERSSFASQLLVTVHNEEWLCVRNDIQ